MQPSPLSFSRALLSLSLLLASGASVARAAVTPNPLFTDHAVLQQGMKVPVWGTADPGEAIAVEVAGKKASTTANADGKWLARLPPLKAGGPFTLTIAGTNKIVLRDVLVGEVWIASGQSNMERQLGLRVGQQPIFNWEKEAAAARYPKIRHFGVAQEKALAPRETVKGQWEVCTPEAVKNFTAVGYFFGRDLHRARHVPVGLIHSSWGGTPAEAWTSEEALRALPDYADISQQLKTLIADPEAAKRHYQARLETWFAANDSGSLPGKAWSAPALDTSGWKTMTLPGLWEEASEPDLNGVVWFRKAFDLPAGAATSFAARGAGGRSGVAAAAAAAPPVGAAELQLGMVDDIDTTWVNGVKVGASVGYDVVRKYSVPAGVLKPGRNVVVVRVLDTGGGGGIWGAEKLQLVLANKPTLAPIDLSGPWQYQIGLNLQNGPWPPPGVIGDVGTPTILYDGMIAPLLPYAIRGVVWYQGESNVRREQQYRSLFPAMIADWRKAWGQDFPFLFVQIAPHQDMTPEIREAQFLAWQHTPKTAMVVTMDCGDAKDIHPTHKQPVGARLALAARALAYGERVEYSGPAYDAMKIDGGNVVLGFTHLDGGLVAKAVAPTTKDATKAAKAPAPTGGPPSLAGFTIASADGVFHPAHAQIRGKTVVVSSGDVPAPVAVRYGWANVPEGNLFNKAGLPASPFRTDGN